MVCIPAEGASVEYPECSVSYSIDRFGAVNDGVTKNTPAIQRALDACADAGGGTVEIPAGTWRTGAFFLKSHTRLFLHPGSIVLGTGDKADYVNPENERFLHALVNAYRAENVSITGYGSIDGFGKIWQDEFRVWHAQHQGRGDALGIRKGRPLRPQLIRFEQCRDIRLLGFTAQNSAAWNIHLLMCEDVIADGLRILNPEHSLNTDGLNPQSCRNVRITNCHISVGDDCICMKAGLPDRHYGACENITVVNCTFGTGHGAIVFGNELNGMVRNLTVANCACYGTYRGIRFKERRGLGGGVENAVFSGFVMRDVAYPIVIDMYNYDLEEDRNAHPVDESTPTIRNLIFSNIIATGAKKGPHFVGLPESPVSDVFLITSMIESENGMICRDVDGMTCRSVQIRPKQGLPLLCESTRNIDCDELLPVAEGEVDAYTGKYMDT
ncbi:MAG: glycoside hydrolase family 28 protein [Chitinivibrionales bacterium]|nr:glycoside hydrolase family 28 protein [Chitinivibrionales bacterium]